MKKLIIILLVIAVAVGGFFAVKSIFGEQAVDEFTENAATMAEEVAIDKLGGMESAEKLLRGNVTTLATDAGLSVNETLSVIDGLDIAGWSTCALPEGLVATSTFDYSLGDTKTTITLYDDPAYVTMTLYDRPVTFEVPEDSREFVSYIDLLCGSR